MDRPEGVLRGWNFSFRIQKVPGSCRGQGHSRKRKLWSHAVLRQRCLAVPRRQGLPQRHGETRLAKRDHLSHRRHSFDDVPSRTQAVPMLNVHFTKTGTTFTRRVAMCWRIQRALCTRKIMSLVCGAARSMSVNRQPSSRKRETRKQRKRQRC